MLATGRKWRRSLAFDLTPAPVLSRERHNLAMACGRFGRYANRVNLLSGHGRFLLGSDEAESVFERIVGTMRDRWLAEMKRAGASEHDCEAVAPAFPYEGLFYKSAT